MCEEFCQWLEAKRQLALANADRVMDVYRRRSAVIGRGTKFKSRTTGELEGALGLFPSKLNRDGNHDIKVSSAEFGLHIEKKDVFSAPEYDAEFISIPGRSGDIINPNRRFANIKVTYTVFLARTRHRRADG